ncbi:MAG: hypothetical protein M1320_01925 [Patescibacteria group bacterium]|nr:hypothetical protein [Patescibacteria group bacterium]
MKSLVFLVEMVYGSVGSHIHMGIFKSLTKLASAIPEMEKFVLKTTGKEYSPKIKVVAFFSDVFSQKIVFLDESNQQMKKVIGRLRKMGFEVLPGEVTKEL